MKGFLEFVLPVQLQFRRGPVGQTLFLACLPSSSSSLALHRSMIGEKDMFLIFLRQPAAPALEDPRIPCPYLFLGFFKIENERTCLCR